MQIHFCYLTHIEISDKLAKVIKIQYTSYIDTCVVNNLEVLNRCLTARLPCIKRG